MSLLVAWLWQGTLLALGARIALRACRRLDAATRHALWWGVLAVVLALPWLTSVGGSPAPVADATALASLPSPAPVVLPSPPDWLLAIALGGWLGTVVVGAIRVARSLSFTRRVKRESCALDADRQRRLPLWSATSASRRAVLVVSPLVRTACAIGLGRAAIVLPPSLLESMDDDALDQIVMHEHAHLERYDDLWRLVETVVDGVAGLHPGVRIALAQIDLEREAACDDRVVLRTGAADRYAACLADAAACAHGPRAPRLLATAVAGRTALVTRVARLLDAGRRRRARLTPAATLAGLVVLGTVAGASARLEPLVAFDTARALHALVLPVTASFAPGLTGRPTAGPAMAGSGVLRTPVLRPGRPSDITRSAGVPLAQAAAEPTATSSKADGGPVPASPVLSSRTLTAVTLAPPAAVGTRPPGARAEPQSPWAAAADGGAAIGGAARRGGAAVGAGAKKAGTSIAGFFARTGRAIGSSF
jgi:beta-lactamase regulating signal transducer with metallopeptidase domain